MRMMLAAAAVMTAAVLSSATTASAQEVLTNDTVVALIDAGLGEQTVIAKIKSSPSSFKVGATDLIALKKQKLSDPVIAAMVDASATSHVSASAMGASDSPNPLAPHASGIYLLGERDGAAKMIRIDATSASQTKSGGLLGYALTAGIAKMKINTVVPGGTARVHTVAARPKFYFYFDQAGASLSGGAVGSVWLAGPGAAVTSPSEFTLVRFKAKGDRREAAVGSFNIAGAKAGVQDNQRIVTTYADVRPGVFEVTPTTDLAPGEYGFVYSTASGGGMGAYAGGATMSRIFDFSVRPTG